MIVLISFFIAVTCCLLMMTELDDDISDWLAVDDVDAEDIDDEE